MSLTGELGRPGPEIGTASAEDHEMLRTVFSTLLERAASSGGSLTRRDIERVRTEFSPSERDRFERFSAVHDAIIAALRDEDDDEVLYLHLVELYAGDVIDALYPEMDGEADGIWREIVIGEIAALIKDWLVRDIGTRLDAARKRLRAKLGAAFSGGDMVVDYEVIYAFGEANRRLDEELRDGAEFGRVLCLAVNDAVRARFGSRATRTMFIGIREADTILDSLVAAQYGNRFRMAVVDPA